MVDTLKDLDSTIIEIKQRISQDPDPLLVEILRKLEAVRGNQQDILERKAVDKQKGGFKGYGVS